MADGSYAFGSTPSPEELAAFDMNDLGNAMRLIRLAGGEITDDGKVDIRSVTLLYQIGAGWVGFNGKHWDRVYGEELAKGVAHKVARTVRSLFAELMSKHGAPPKDVIGFMNRCGSAGATDAMLRQARVYLTVEIDVFDNDPMALNCRNGTLKLRVDGARLVRDLRPHDPADRITKMTACDYLPEADCPLFKSVFDFSFPNKEEGGYFRRHLGYGVTGLVREQSFLVCQGRGQDGKSTMLDAGREAVGTYGETADVKTFLEGMQTSAGGPSPDLAKLAGEVRFVVVSEPKRGSVWDESRLKSWTSGSPMTTRDLNAKNFNFRPKGKLFIECNPFPRPKGDDHGFWRRIKVCLFRRQVPDDQRDPDLQDKIREAELSGVLNWLLDGLEDYLCAGGMRPPKALVDFIANYKSQASPFNDWLESRCVHGSAAEGHWTPSKDLMANYKAWHVEQGNDEKTAMTMRAFGDAMSDRQILVKKDRRGNKVRGPIRLKLDWEIEAEAADDVPDPGAATGDVRPAGAGGGSGEGQSEAGGLPLGDYYAEPGAFEPDADDGQ